MTKLSNCLNVYMSSEHVIYIYSYYNILINSLLQTNVHIHVKNIYIIQSKKKKKLKQHTDKKLYAELI